MWAVRNSTSNPNHALWEVAIPTTKGLKRITGETPKGVERGAMTAEGLVAIIVIIQTTNTACPYPRAPTMGWMPGGSKTIPEPEEMGQEPYRANTPQSMLRSQKNQL